MPGMASGNLPGAHDCCKKGWTAATPECCLVSQAPEAPGRLGARPVVMGPPMQPAIYLTAVFPSTPRQVGDPSPEDDHSPPGPLVLRV